MWTASALASEFGDYAAPVWRIVEGQHRISTNRLATSLVDQARLEELIEAAKPDLPKSAQGLHYLLAAPFRYGHEVASRFRRPNERPGIFYASETETTALTEVAYWRLRFFAASRDFVPPVTGVEHTSFKVVITSNQTLDLTQPPFDDDIDAWTDAADYSRCQEFADAAREADAGIIRTPSARDRPHGINLVIFDAGVFGSVKPQIARTWQLRLERGALIAFAAFPSKTQLSFSPEQFGIRPLPY
jgi:hypothetical protein